jgi:chaperonin GroEL (HSP60 family)
MNSLSDALTNIEKITTKLSASTENTLLRMERIEIQLRELVEQRHELAEVLLEAMEFYQLPATWEAHAHAALKRAGFSF